jgi:flagellar motor switch protein FliG
MGPVGFLETGIIYCDDNLLRLSQFPAEIQVDVVRRMAASQQTEDNMLKKVADIIRTKSGMLGEVRNTPDDPRYKKVAEVINLLGSAAEEQILKELATDSPEMAKKLREMMFTFEDMLALSNTDMRKVLMSIDTQILAMAMKTASEELKEKVFSNLSKRATETLTEEMELLGPKPLSQVKTAQQQIVEVVRKMDAGSEINIRGSKYEEDPLV